MFDTENTPDSTSVETETPVEAVETQSETTPNQEFDIDKADNVASIRTYAKGLKTDLESYKPSHEFIKSKFGDTKNAEVAYSLYQTFADENFDPDNFEKVLSQLSPARTQKLFETKASTKAEELAQTKVKELFGGKAPTADELKRYNDWVKSGYGLGEGDDIPDALKFDSQGNPKSDEEIQFLRDLQKSSKERNSFEKQQADLQRQKEEEDRETARQTRVNEFTNARLDVLHKELDILGLKELPTDTQVDKENKTLLRNFILNGVSGIYLNSPAAAKDFQTAMGHLNENEVLLARKYEANIEDALLKIVRGDALKTFFNALAKPDVVHDGRPEISNTGASSNSDDGGGRKPNESADEMFARLVREGKIKA
jgi:hypothetical protein